MSECIKCFLYRQPGCPRVCGRSIFLMLQSPEKYQIRFSSRWYEGKGSTQERSRKMRPEADKQKTRLILARALGIWDNLPNVKTFKGQRTLRIKDSFL